jgi:hypothetical protein
MLSEENEMQTQAQFSNAELSIIITRADGTVEDLGVVATMRPPTLLEKIKEVIKNGRCNNGSKQRAGNSK